jgi:hypothetical protein
MIHILQKNPEKYKPIVLSKVAEQLSNVETCDANHVCSSNPTAIDIRSKVGPFLPRLFVRLGVHHPAFFARLAKWKGGFQRPGCGLHNPGKTHFFALPGEVKCVLVFFFRSAQGAPRAVPR